MISKTSGCLTSTNEPTMPLVVLAWDDLLGGGLCRCGCAQGGDDWWICCQSWKIFIGKPLENHQLERVTSRFPIVTAIGKPEENHWMGRCEIRTKPPIFWMVENPTKSMGCLRPIHRTWLGHVGTISSVSLAGYAGEISVKRQAYLVGELGVQHFPVTGRFRLSLGCSHNSWLFSERGGWTMGF